MMQRAVFLTALGLFFIKLVWNVILPVMLETRHKARQKSGGSPVGAVSMQIEVELALWLLMMLISSVYAGDLLARTIDIFLYGAAAIIISYLLASLFTFLIRKISWSGG